MEIEIRDYAILHIEIRQNNFLNRKRGIKIGLGNRGMVFEMHINLANEMYQRGRVALINRHRTPVKGAMCYIGSRRRRSDLFLPY